MKRINLREANQQFSRLVREVQETGEPVVVLRNGEDAVMISRPRDAARLITEEQERALESLLESARTRPGDSTKEPGWTRDDLHGP